MQADRSAGKEWFDLPATTITPELKNDLRILKMRGALDPSRHYKKNDTKELPKYFQVIDVCTYVYVLYNYYVFVCSYNVCMYVCTYVHVCVCVRVCV